MHHPIPPPAPQGFLMQKIIARHRTSIPCFSTEVQLDGCQCTVLKSVTACGPAAVTPCGERTVQLAIPVSVCAADACGRLCTQTSVIHVQADLPRSFLCAPDPRSSLLALPSVCLVRAENAGCGCFRVQLHITLDLYLLRYEACGCPPPRPACPQLPLYPPPMC